MAETARLSYTLGSQEEGEAGHWPQPALSKTAVSLRRSVVASAFASSFAQ
jgi:hypothetical protein